MTIESKVENTGIDKGEDSGLVCPACGYVASSKQDLSEHRKSTHGRLTPIGRSSLASSIASLALRGFLGTTMIMHGAPKLGKKKEQTVEGMQKIGVPKGVTISASLLEVVGGASLLAGFMVPVVSSLFAAEMAGTTFLSKQKMDKQFLTGGEKPSYELNVMYMVAFSTLAAIGGGDFSVDRLLRI